MGTFAMQVRQSILETYVDACENVLQSDYRILESINTNNLRGL
jgi:hypothetical protein